MRFKSNSTGRLVVVCSCCLIVWPVADIYATEELNHEGSELVCESSDYLLTQSVSLEIVFGTGVACNGQGYTPENFFARSYLMISDIEITCVGFGVEANTGNAPAHPATINIYLDTDGGAPQAAGIDLDLLGSSDVVITPESPGTIIYGNYDPPVIISAGQVIVVEFHVSDGSGITGIWPGSNNLGQTGPSYIKSASCGNGPYIDLADWGHPNSHYVQTIEGYKGAVAECPWDLDESGSVGTNDLLELFAQWGTVGSADFDGDGTVNTSDLLILFINWGPCP